MLDIDMEFKQGILFVRLKGILNGDTCIKFEKDLIELISNNGIKYLLLNLNNIKYIDRYGLKSIYKNYELIVHNNGKMIICGINKLFDYEKNIIGRLYQVKDEESVYGVVNI